MNVYAIKVLLIFCVFTNKEEKMYRVVIVIPIYQSSLSEIEKNSLLQCFKILGKYPVKFVCPKDFDVSHYEKLLQGNNYDFSFERFDDKYFRSVPSYSKLMLTKKFYKRFTGYEFMLIYQLDAWVFNDDLEYWCNQNYDYIGAPWFEGYDTANNDSNLLPVAGNGGFSLRKISSILKVLNVNLKTPRSFKDIYDSSSKRKKISKILNIPIYFLKFISQKELFLPVWKTTKLYEDIAYVEFAQKACKEFRLAPPEVTLQFSFETQPKRLYEMNNNKLPFGCHAWEKYEPDFWKEFIRF